MNGRDQNMDMKAMSDDDLIRRRDTLDDKVRDGRG